MVVVDNSVVVVGASSVVDCSWGRLPEEVSEGADVVVVVVVDDGLIRWRKIIHLSNSTKNEILI